MKTVKITHPKADMLFATIEKLDGADLQEINDNLGEQHEEYYETKIFGSDDLVDWAATYEEAEKNVISELEYIYNGSASRDRAADRECARQERYACGNY